MDDSLAIPGGHSLVDGDVVELWLSLRRKDSTRKQYERTWRDLSGDLELPDGSARSLRSITLRQLVRWVDERGGAVATRRRRIAVVRSLMSFAFEVQAIPSNLAALLPVPLPEKTLKRTRLLGADAERVIALCNARDAALLGMYYYSGMRVGEPLPLRWGNLQPAPGDDGTLLVAVGEKSGKRRLRLGKSQSRGLGRMRAEHGPDDFVFASPRGGHLSARGARYIVARAGERAELGFHLHPHLLRHAHATEAIERGCPLHVLRDSLGHASVAQTSEYVASRVDACSALFF